MLHHTPYIRPLPRKKAECIERLINGHIGDLNSLPSTTSSVAINCEQGGTQVQWILEEPAVHNIFVRKSTAPIPDHFICVSAQLDSTLDYFEQFSELVLKATGQ